MRISDWSSDVCSSDLIVGLALDLARPPKEKWPQSWSILPCRKSPSGFGNFNRTDRANMIPKPSEMSIPCITDADMIVDQYRYLLLFRSSRLRSEEHTSEFQSLMRISYADFCLKKKTQQKIHVI